MILATATDMLTGMADSWQFWLRVDRAKPVQSHGLSLGKVEWMRILLLTSAENRDWRRKQFRLNVPWASATALFLVATLANRADAETLTWKFKPGQVLHYVMEQKSVMTASAGGRQTKSTRTYTMNFTWTVGIVGEDGVAQITQHIDRMRTRVESPPYMPFEFDSKGPKSDAQGPYEFEEKLMTAMTGSEFSFKMKPNGEIDGITFSPATLKAFKTAAPSGGQGGGGEIQEQAMKDQLLQSSPPAFPTTPLEPGATWTGKAAKIPSPLGTIVLDKVFTFIGPDPKDPRLLLVNMDSRVTLEPAENAELSAKIRSHDGKVTVTFDADAGRIATTKGTDKTTLSISGMGQTLEQVTEATTLMTFEP
jgi:hypothetical protein